MARRFRKRDKPSGAGVFLFATLIVTSLFLCLNVPFVRYLHIVASQRWSQLTHPKATQMALLLGPVLLLIVEWWIVDQIASRVRARS